MARRFLIAGNWKMNGLKADGLALAGDVASRTKSGSSPKFEILVCPAATLISSVIDKVAGSGVAVGGQDCHMQEKGAHTGDISAWMLKDLGCTYVIVGHSERRTNHGETDAVVKAKAEAALAAGLIAIVCVGETLEERDAGKTSRDQSATGAWVSSRRSDGRQHRDRIRAGLGNRNRSHRDERAGAGGSSHDPGRAGR